MSSSSRILAAVSALALTAATAAPLAGAADNPAPKLVKGSPILFVDNQINPGVSRSPSAPTARSIASPTARASTGAPGSRATATP